MSHWIVGERDVRQELKKNHTRAYLQINANRFHLHITETVLVAYSKYYHYFTYSDGLLNRSGSTFCLPLRWQITRL